MKMSAVTARLQAILERDWKGEAAVLLAERKATGDGLVCLLASLLHHWPDNACSSLQYRDAWLRNHGILDAVILVDVRTGLQKHWNLISRASVMSIREWPRAER